MSKVEIEREIARLRQRLTDLACERSEIEATLSGLEKNLDSVSIADPAMHVFEAAPVRSKSPSSDKIALFRRLFVGRSDVFPSRWENRKAGRSGYSPACSNEWVRGVCAKPKVKCTECPHQAFIPVTDEIIERHLRGGHGSGGDFVAGVYPLLADETCWFLAADFDKEAWVEDATALLRTCRDQGVATALERSRSGNGGHVWIFFQEPVPARTARQMGAALITETMEKRPEIGLSSYDRFFPSQDTMPVGGFGNLIALPLQRRAREQGNSVFIDENLRPYDDQWVFLLDLTRNPADCVFRIAGKAEASERILGVRMPVDDEFADEPWRMTPSRRTSAAPISIPVPKILKAVSADQLYLERTEMSPGLVAQFIRVAAFQNPEFPTGHRPCDCRPSASRESYRARSFIPSMSRCRAAASTRWPDWPEVTASTFTWRTGACSVSDCRRAQRFRESCRRPRGEPLRISQPTTPVSSPRRRPSARRWWQPS